MRRSSVLDESITGEPGAASLWHDVGEAVLVDGSEPLLLLDTDQVWLLEAGSLDVFSVELDAGAPAGRREPLFRCAAPALVSGASLAADGRALCLLGVAVQQARLRRLATVDLVAALTSPERMAEAQRLATAWIDQLAGSAAPARRPRGARLVTEPGILELSAGETLEAGAAGLWARVVDGGASLFGDEAHLPLVPEDSWLPLATSAWLVASVKSQIEIASFATVRASAAHLVWFRHAAGLGIRAIETRRRDRDHAATLETSSEAEASRSELSVALDSAASLFGRRVLHPVASASTVERILAACQEIGLVAAIEFRRPPVRRIEGCRDPVDEICRASRVRAREVVLEGQWWRRDNGPLLGFVARENGEPVPVALLPRSPRSYSAVDPAAGSSVPVDAAYAASLQSSGFMFYRPLPETDVTAGTLLRHAFRSNGTELFMIVGMALLGGLIAMATPIMTAVVFGTIVPAGERSQLGQVAMGLIVAGLASAAFGLTKDMAILRFEGRADNGLEAALWDRLLALPVEFHRGFSAGDLANRVNGINTIRQLLTSASLNAVLTGLFSIFSLAMVFYYSWKLAILAVILAAVAVVVELATGWLQLGPQRASADRAGRLEAIVLQQLVAIGKLRVAGGEERAFARWMAEYLEKTKVEIRAKLIANAASTFSAVWTILSTLLVFGVYYFFLGDALQTGDFLGFNAAFGQFMHAQLGAAGAAISLVRTLPLFERAQPILRALPEAHAGRGDPGELSGEIELRNVTFRYAAGLRPTLDGVDLRIRAGEYVAFVGATGAGKTTIVKLLLGFERPESGEVLFDGKDLRGLDPVALRRQLGIVLQDGRLLAGDIFHTIVGSTRLDEAAAWKAAEAAVIADEIRALPMGMHTYVAEGGRNISGGQRQRLLLAQALVHDPAILILDEATSALDNTSQAKVIESLDRLRATRLVVAHRLSTIRNADRILVLDQGRIVQEGSFAELMATDGLFKELAERQIA